MKFGGTSVATLSKMKHAAQKIKTEVEDGNNVIVVVSAMAGITDELIDKVIKISPIYDAREYDAIVSSGENISAALMSLLLQNLEINTRSWQGWQIPIKTTEDHSNARIKDIKTKNLIKKFNDGMQVAVISGFQGVSDNLRITTLGRGGSDTTAVALAAAFDAYRCDIYTDVDGVFTTDPKITPNAQKLEKISYEEMLELASLGAKVLQTRSVELAMSYNVKLRVLNSFTEGSGTLVCGEEDIMEKRVVSGITFSKDEAKLTLVRVKDKPGIAGIVFDCLSRANINVDMIIQNISEDGLTDVTFSCPTNQVNIASQALKQNKSAKMIDYYKLIEDKQVAKISIVGIGMRSHSGVAQTMFKTLGEENINIKVISTSEIKISVLIDRKYLELAVQALHEAFKLGKTSN
jgi:aspartate kinase